MGRPAKYPWNEWLDGSQRILLEGQDYDCTTPSMKTMLQQRAQISPVPFHVEHVEGGLAIKPGRKQQARSIPVKMTYTAAQWQALGDAAIKESNERFARINAEEQAMIDAYTELCEAEPPSRVDRLTS